MSSRLFHGIVVAAAMAISSPQVNGATMRLVPIRASGSQGADWVLGPGSDEITLLTTGQSVSLEVRISDFAPDRVQVFQATLDCATFDSGTMGSLTPIPLGCLQDLAGNFNGTFCQGINLNRPDFVFAGAVDYFTCNVVNPCPNTVPGHFACAGVPADSSSTPDNGSSYYTNTFAVAVSPDAQGSFSLGLDPSSDWSFLVGENFAAIAPLTLAPALITVAPDAGCPNNCSENGSCVGGVCVCQPGWTGNNCAEATCPNDCSGQGQCNSGTCICDAGWTGADCSVPTCPNDCSGHGQCNAGTCTCDEGWGLADCSVQTCTNDCSGHGLCLGGVCFCDQGWGGDDCSVQTCPNDCSGHGQCLGGVCDCDEGWGGDDCAMPPPSDPIMRLVPIRASGAQGADWVLGPGSDEITLLTTGQSVSLEVRISDFAPNLLSAYQATLDCATFDSGTMGSLTPIPVDCGNDLGGNFNGTFCQGIDVSRADLVFPGLENYFACNVVDLCPNDEPGHFACGGTPSDSSIASDNGGSFYAMTFAVAVSPDAEGSFSLGLDPSSNWSFLVDDGFLLIPSTVLIPAKITIANLAAPAADSELAGSCMDNVDCENTASCVGGACYVPKNRSLSIAPSSANTFQTARRISVETDSGPIVLGWMGVPDPKPLMDGRLVSLVTDQPVYRDWRGDGSIELGGCHVSPGHAYLIEATEDGVTFSGQLRLETTGFWGDVVGATVGGVTAPPQGVANLGDAQAIVKGFLDINTAPKHWLDLEPQDSNNVINLVDARQAVRGFQDGVYPFADPCSCAGLAPCP